MMSLRSFIHVLIKKGISGFTGIILYRIEGKFRFFINSGIFGRIYQTKYLWRDYIFKRKYRIIDYDGEFGPELKFVLPFAYWHHLNGTLKATYSSLDTAVFYFFSENHQEIYAHRRWNNFNFDFSIPNSHDHDFAYDLSKWARVPLKEKFQNDLFMWDKPSLVISNKFNTEWGGEPVNFISLDSLSVLIEILGSEYHIIYNRPCGSTIANDNSRIGNFGDKELVEELGVTDLEDLQSKYPEMSFNEIQLRVYSNCERFISVQGGNSVLCSYFGGTNIVLSKYGFENYFREFESFYPRLSGADIVVARNPEDLLMNVKARYLA